MREAVWIIFIWIKFHWKISDSLSIKEIIFNSQMNLAVQGSNSSGKESILEAVCIALGAYLLRLRTMSPTVLCITFLRVMFA